MTHAIHYMTHAIHYMTHAIHYTLCHTRYTPYDTCAHYMSVLNVYMKPRYTTRLLVNDLL
jgi:hypothetical protein